MKVPGIFVSATTLLGVFSGAVALLHAIPPVPANGTLRKLDDRSWMAAAPGKSDINLKFPNGTAFVLDSANGTYVLPTLPSNGTRKGAGRAWWLPANSTATSNSSVPSSYMITADGPISVDCGSSTCNIIVSASSATLKAHLARPYADIHGDEFALDFPGGDDLADAMAAFYWTTMLPCVIEHTLALEYPISEGFIISTLASTYVGTYPDVDHEFQIKGRVAIGSDVDLSIVRRMIELELKLAREDYCGLWRTPCALQPSGAREYNVRRNSEDGKTNAIMFLVSGNVEMLESVWLYVARTKDLKWLEAHIEDIEMTAWGVEEYIDTEGRLWSDVYYEDQVMKDGRETMSAALASRAFGLLAELEVLLARQNMASYYTEVQSKLAKSIAEPLPTGYWDPSVKRFTDWVDRNGWAHDHIHLLANILPVMLGIADSKQSSSVLSMIEAEMDEFQRFPTFLAARIQDYNSTEIGDGGPYDLCAAGRYWCWDAAFWAWRGNGGMLHDQLTKVADLARTEGYIMGERYDMDYIYYVDESPWHGAAHYYEYPCVFGWVLLHDYIGVQPSLNADVLISPRLVDKGTVDLKQAAYRLSYTYEVETFILKNLANEKRSFELDLSALYPHAKTMTLETGGIKETKFTGRTKVTLDAGSSLEINVS